MRRSEDAVPPVPGSRVQQFLMGVAAGLTAQVIIAFWRWVRAPALGR